MSKKRKILYPIGSIPQQIVNIFNLAQIKILPNNDEVTITEISNGNENLSDLMNFACCCC